jgi:hypothetical protein
MQHSTLAAGGRLGTRQHKCCAGSGCGLTLSAVSLVFRQRVLDCPRPGSTCCCCCCGPPLPRMSSHTQGSCSRADGMPKTCEGGSLLPGPAPSSLGRLQVQQRQGCKSGGMDHLVGADFVHKQTLMLCCTVEDAGQGCQAPTPSARACDTASLHCM